VYKIMNAHQPTKTTIETTRTAPTLFPYFIRFACNINRILVVFRNKLRILSYFYHSRTSLIEELGITEDDVTDATQTAETDERRIPLSTAMNRYTGVSLKHESVSLNRQITRDSS